MNDLLIIFVRNPELGNVKTRLAQSLGEGAALAIYLKLISHTQAVTEDLACDKAVYYSSYVDSEDSWDNKKYKKFLQKGESLGEKMKHAIGTALDGGYTSVCLIGSDNYEITPDIIENAFNELKSHDVVIGPARDGGYYLIGLSKVCPEIFDLERWSTPDVFNATLKIINQNNLSFSRTKLLNDIDVPEDLKGTDLLNIIGHPRGKNKL